MKLSERELEPTELTIVSGYGICFCEELMEGPDSETLGKVARQFLSDGQLSEIQPFGTGNVNDTYLARVTGGADTDFVLQRINQQVFNRPELISANLRVFTTHVQKRLLAEDEMTSAGLGSRWETPRILSTFDEQDYVHDGQGGFWRALSLITHARTFPAILNSAHAREAGFALGRFHNLISDLDPQRLHDTLVGFHITPLYLKHFDKILSQTEVDLTDTDVAWGISYIGDNRQRIQVLEAAKARGELIQRSIHGDPKIDNILIDTRTEKAIGIIDLDTVKPGLIHYDIGDCLRSCCNVLGEETDEIDQVHFDVELCRIILDGYLSVAHEFFGQADYKYLYESIWLIAFELGLRFLTDYLAGNVYFKASFDTHNLQRGLVQLRLAQSIEKQEQTIRLIIGEYVAH